MQTLKHIDLGKRTGCEHPDLNEESSYLALIEGDWYVGQFSHERNGWNFTSEAGYQLDEHAFSELYEIVSSLE